MSAPRCLFCGEPERVEILEIYSPREFELDTCCQGMLDSASEYLAEDPKAAAAWLREKGLDAYTGQRSRRIVDDGCGSLVIDWQPEIVPIEQAQAKAFVNRHHRHCAAPVGWRYGAGIRNGLELIGVIMAGRPVARALGANIIEVNRLAIRTDIADGLAWNACSQAYAWAAREAVKRGFRKIITYTMATEAGTSLKAAGWVIEHVSPARRKGWDSPGRRRSREAGMPTAGVAKFRWTPARMADPVMVEKAAAVVAGMAAIEAEARSAATTDPSSRGRMVALPPRPCPVTEPRQEIRP